jgi:putative membrane protein
MLHGNDGWGWGAWLSMGLGMLAFTALIVWVVVMLIRGRTDSDETALPPSAEDVLALRLAEGQIEPAEYQERLAALHGSKKVPAPS